jgi:hypothetical protein
MKTLLLGFSLCLVWCAQGCVPQSHSINGRGTLFIRQQICDLNDFKTRFFTQPNDLKGRGFLDYRFYRDTNDPKTYILIFDCADMKKAEAFLRSSNFIVACVGAGTGGQVMWEGEAVSPGLAAEKGSLVLARLDAKDAGAIPRARRYQTDNGAVVAEQTVTDIYQARIDWQTRKKLDVWFGTYLESGTYFIVPSEGLK